MVAVSPRLDDKVFESLDELENLCQTIDFEVVEKIVQRRDKPDPATYLGFGKLEKLKTFCKENNVDALVFNDEISPIQQRNVEEFLELEVLDRTQVILEIFSRHATTHEGKLQVEMAKLTYELPRLRGKGLYLSNPGAGIGTRGPGEKLLELEKRKIKERISSLKRELLKIKKERENIRKARLESGYRLISIAGYTNAGKSTLLKKLSEEKSILVSEKLFSTLSPKIRRVKFPNGRAYLFSDTVGFIDKLPHTLIEAFHSTLEEVLYADLILLLVDASDSYFKDKIKASYNVLNEIGVTDKEVMLVFNKIDIVPESKLEIIRYEYPKAIFISARSGIGLDVLYSRISEYFQFVDSHIRLRLRQSEFGKVLRYAELITYDALSSNDEFIDVDLSGPIEVLEKIKSSISAEK
ncbi:MAG: GTPase HflX [Fervidobacterium sp.]|uniref:GTPase HflX n=1 Tax=Fervidobacterium sp. TaxID=1871331 RepID=UPI0040499254